MELSEWKQRLDQVFSLPTEEEQYNAFRGLILENKEDTYSDTQIGRDIKDYVVSNYGDRMSSLALRASRR